MTSDNYLFICIILVLTFAGYLVITNKSTPEEIDKMLDDEEIWP